MPYVPLDRVCAVDGERATAIKNVTFTEDYLATHFPQFPVVPGAMLIDSVLELAGVLLEHSVGSHGGVILRSIRRARFKRFVRPGDQLEVVAELVAVDHAANSAIVRGSLRVDGEEACSISDMTVCWRAAAGSSSDDGDG